MYSFDKAAGVFRPNLKYGIVLSIVNAQSDDPYAFIKKRKKEEITINQS